MTYRYTVISQAWGQHPHHFNVFYTISLDPFHFSSAQAVLGPLTLYILMQLDQRHFDLLTKVGRPV
jgi:hypothetical protein